MTLLFCAKGFDEPMWREALAREAPERPVIGPKDESRFGEVRHALVWKPGAGLLARLPKLEVIVNLGAGVDAILADQTVPPHIPILRAVDPNITMRMTEWVVLQVLFQHRQMAAYQAQQRGKIWRDLPQKPASAVNVGVLGIGALGESAGSALAMMGFQVAGWSRTAEIRRPLRDVPWCGWPRRPARAHGLAGLPPAADDRNNGCAEL